MDLLQGSTSWHVFSRSFCTAQHKSDLQYRKTIFSPRLSFALVPAFSCRDRRWSKSTACSWGLSRHLKDKGHRWSCLQPKSRGSPLCAFVAWPHRATCGPHYHHLHSMCKWYPQAALYVWGTSHFLHPIFSTVDVLVKEDELYRNSSPCMAARIRAAFERWLCFRVYLITSWCFSVIAASIILLPT